MPEVRQGMFPAMLQDTFADDSPHHLDELQRDLMAAFQHYLPSGCQAPEQLREMLADHLPLGMLTDLAAYALPLGVSMKQRLLAECRVDVRAQMLLEQLEAQATQEPAVAMADIFPPPFSVN